MHTYYIFIKYLILKHTNMQNIWNKLYYNDYILHMYCVHMYCIFIAYLTLKEINIQYICNTFCYIDYIF